MKLSETKAETDKDGKEKSLISRVDRYKCAVTNDILRNTTTLFVLKPTGAYTNIHSRKANTYRITPYESISEIKALKLKRAKDELGVFSRRPCLYDVKGFMLNHDIC